VSKDANRCDACNRRLRPNQHEMCLIDLMTNQEVGRYHAGVNRDCQSAAARYLTGGAALIARIYHPSKCGENQQHCNGGLSESAA